MRSAPNSRNRGFRHAQLALRLFMLQLRSRQEDMPNAGKNYTLHCRDKVGLAGCGYAVPSRMTGRASFALKYLRYAQCHIAETEKSWRSVFATEVCNAASSICIVSMPFEQSRTTKQSSSNCAQSGVDALNFHKCKSKRSSANSAQIGASIQHRQAQLWHVTM